MIVRYALLTADNSDAVLNKNDIHAISNELPVFIKNTCSILFSYFLSWSFHFEIQNDNNLERWAILNDFWAEIEHSVIEHWMLCEQWALNYKTKTEIGFALKQNYKLWMQGDPMVNARWLQGEQWMHCQETVSKRKNGKLAEEFENLDAIFFLIENGKMRFRYRQPATSVPAIGDEGNIVKSGDVVLM